MMRRRITIAIIGIFILAIPIFSPAGEIPTNTINVVQGQEFKITLESNRRSGYKWQLTAPLDSKMIKFLGSEYLKKAARLPELGGREIWKFKALSPGKTEIILRYVRSQGTNQLLVREKKFVVIISR